MWEAAWKNAELEENVRLRTVERDGAEARIAELEALVDAVYVNVVRANLVGTSPEQTATLLGRARDLVLDDREKRAPRDSVSEDVELDSPNFVPQELKDLSARPSETEPEWRTTVRKALERVDDQVQAVSEVGTPQVKQAAQILKVQHESDAHERTDVLDLAEALERALAEGYEEGRRDASEPKSCTQLSAEGRVCECCARRQRPETPTRPPHPSFPIGARVRVNDDPTLATVVPPRPPRYVYVRFDGEPDGVQHPMAEDELALVTGSGAP